MPAAARVWTRCRVPLAALFVLAAACLLRPVWLPAQDASGARAPAHAPAAFRTENLVGFARLYGLVRFFHPTDEVRTADWNAIAVDGVRRIGACTSTECMVSGLRAAFGPIAPSVTIARCREARGCSRSERSPSSAPRYRVWVHHGVATGDSPLPWGSGPYSSLLTTVAADAESMHVEPSEVVVALPFGIEARVPMRLPIDSRSDTTPRSYALPKTPRPASRDATDTRAERVAAVIAAWSILREFYPYAREMRIAWDRELRRALAGALAAPDDAAFLRVLKRLMASLQDGHAYAFSRVEPTDGWPLAPDLLLDWVEDAVVVTRVGLRERAAGLAPGTIVEAVDGIPIRTAFERAIAEESGATPAYRRLRALRYMLLGTPGSSVRLTVRRSGGLAIDTVTLTRHARPPRATDRAWTRATAIEDVGQGVLYVDLARITEDSLPTLMPRLSRAPGVILDYRGGPPFDTELLLPAFVPRVVYSQRFGIAERRHPASVVLRERQDSIRPGTPRIDGVVVALIGTASVSAVETSLSYVAGTPAVTLVGQRTAGTTGVINGALLPGGYGMQFTGMYIRRADGGRFHGVGLQPDVVVAPTVAGVLRGEDETLTAAVALVHSRLARHGRGSPRRSR